MKKRKSRDDVLRVSCLLLLLLLLLIFVSMTEGRLFVRTLRRNGTPT